MSSGGLSLYREVLRSVRLLPVETRSYYRVVAREKFAAHREEEDAERLALIIERKKSRRSLDPGEVLQDRHRGWAVTGT